MPVRVVTRRRSAPTPPPSTIATLTGLPTPPAGYEQREAGLSVCMIVKNEERFLRQCLNSVKDIADELCIADTGSTDETVAIAREFGAKLVEIEWRDDFAWARNRALELATKRWILMIDADEELLPESLPTLNALKNTPAYDTAVWLRCYNDSDDYRGTGAMSHAMIRIFPNNDEIRYRGLIHEYPAKSDLPLGLKGIQSPVAIVHHGYMKDVVAARKKGERNLAIVEEAARKEPEESFHWFNLGSTAYMVGDYERARDGLERMREINGLNARGFIPNGLSLLAEIYLDKFQDAEKAEEVSRFALQLSPRYANAHFQLGKTLSAQRKFEEAREAFLLAIEDGAYSKQQFVVDDEVSIWKAHSEIGSTYAAEKDDVKAVEWYEKGLKNRPTVQPLHANRARALERLGRFEDAQETLRHCYREYCDEMSTLDYVNFLLRHNKGILALEVIDESHEALPDKLATALLMTAAMISTRKGMPLTERYLLAAARRSPGSGQILDPLEVILRARGENDTISSLRAAEAQSDPIEAGDFARRVRLRLEDRAFAEALLVAERGLEAFPNDAALGYDAAIALSNLGRRQEALNRLDSISEANEELHVQIGLLRATLLRDDGRVPEALIAVRQLLDAHSGQLDATLLYAGLLEMSGDANGAQRILETALPQNCERVSVELASLHLRRGDFESAKRVADAALR